MPLRRPVKDEVLRTGDLVLKHRLATPREIREALNEQRLRRRKSVYSPQIGEILIEKDILRKDQLHRILQEQDRSKGLVSKIENGRHGCVILRLKGSMDSLRGESIRVCLDRLLDRGLIRFVVDGSELTYIDSHGVSIFIACVDECRTLGGDIKFARIGRRVGVVLRNLGIDHFIQIFDDVSAAENAFNRSIDEMMVRGSVSEYIAGERGKLVHLSYCSQARKIASEEQLFYPSRQEAILAGKVPCPRCCP